MIHIRLTIFLIALSLVNTTSALNVLTNQLFQKIEEENWDANIQADWSPELRAVLERHRQAVLGGEAPEVIKAMILKGRYVLGDESYNFTVKKERPHYFRLDLVTPSGVMLQAYDGERGWFVPAGMDIKKGAEWMDRQTNAAMARDAIMLNYLLEFDSEHVALELIYPNRPIADEIGIKVTLPNGGLINYWLDSETYLVSREVKTDYEDGGFKFRTIELSDYREVGGIQFAHVATHYLSGKLEAKLFIDEIEIVDALSPLLFIAPILEVPDQVLSTDLNTDPSGN